MSSDPMRTTAGLWSWITSCPSLRPSSVVWVPLADLADAEQWLECQVLEATIGSAHPDNHVGRFTNVIRPTRGFRCLMTAGSAYIEAVRPRGMLHACQDLRDPLLPERLRSEASIVEALRSIGWRSVSVQILDEVALMKGRST